MKYVGRYLGRPAIGNSRIDEYDGEYVTFHYHRHEDKGLVIERVPALEFIERLIQHIPEKHFKMIRYYGIYGRNRDFDKHIYRAVSKEKHKILRSFNRWRDSILFTFGYDPLECTKCGSKMIFDELYFKNTPVSLHELYEKVMAKARCRSPTKIKTSQFALTVVKS
jgi:hypothetical protein